MVSWTPCRPWTRSRRTARRRTVWFVTGSTSWRGARSRRRPSARCGRPTATSRRRRLSSGVGDMICLCLTMRFCVEPSAWLPYNSPQNAKCPRNCAACAAPLAHNAPRISVKRYCKCQHDHWRRGTTDCVRKYTAAATRNNTTPTKNTRTPRGRVPRTPKGPGVLHLPGERPSAHQGGPRARV